MNRSYAIPLLILGFLGGWKQAHSDSVPLVHGRKVAVSKSRPKDQTPKGGSAFASNDLPPVAPSAPEQLPAPVFGAPAPGAPVSAVPQVLSGHMPVAGPGCERSESLSVVASPDSCGPACMGCPECSSTQGARFWVRGEGLIWWLEGADVPALVTVSDPGVPQATAGTLQSPGTRVLFGNSGLDDEVRGGGRISAGMWLDTFCPIGVEANFFILSDVGNHFTATPQGNQAIARPFFDISQNVPNRELVSFPGVATGSVQIDSTSSFLGAEVYLRENLCNSGSCGWESPFFAGMRVDGLAGYRTIQLRETLRIRSSSVSINNPPLAPNTLSMVEDFFDTDNEFHGGVFGLITTWQRGQMEVEMQTKLMVGATHHRLEVSGLTTQSFDGQSGTVPAGLLAQPTNNSRYADSDFTIIPEINMTVRWALTTNLQLLAGYSFLYWGNVFRPGDQIDPVVNPTQISGPLAGDPRPVQFRKEGDVWVQGLHLGVEFRH